MAFAFHRIDQRTAHTGTALVLVGDQIIAIDMLIVFNGVRVTVHG